MVKNKLYILTTALAITDHRIVSLWFSYADAATSYPATVTQPPATQPPSTTFRNPHYWNCAGGQVEVFSWWVGPGEADGLAAMVKVFNQMYPNITFVNAAVAGGAGTNAKAVLATRLAANDPPDSVAGSRRSGNHRQLRGSRPGTASG